MVKIHKVINLLGLGLESVLGIGLGITQTTRCQQLSVPRPQLCYMSTCSTSPPLSATYCKAHTLLDVVEGGRLALDGRMADGQRIQGLARIRGQGASSVWS